MNNIESTIVSRTPVAVETGTRSLAQGNFLDENSRKNINVIEQTCDSDSQTYRWQSLFFFLTNNFIHRELPDDAKTIFIYVALHDTKITRVRTVALLLNVIWRTWAWNRHSYTSACTTVQILKRRTKRHCLQNDYEIFENKTNKFSSSEFEQT